jgi:3-methyladenine DNA glycosylase/8-oxoguanine DNA glycosylase
MTNEQITQLIKEKNAELEKNLSTQASNIVSYIVQQQAVIKTAQKMIVSFQKQLKELTFEPLDAASFLGE